VPRPFAQKTVSESGVGLAPEEKARFVSLAFKPVVARDPLGLVDEGQDAITDVLDGSACAGPSWSSGSAIRSAPAVRGYRKRNGKRWRSR
jgi:hypothetical protein